MDRNRLKEQVEIIREAFGYINRFKGSMFVMKLDSSLITHSFFPLLIRDIVHLHQAGIHIVIVPGARTRINQILKTYGIRCRTVGGVRVSTSKAIPFVKMAAFDVSNRIMTLLAENNTSAIVGNWVQARGIGVKNGIDFQHSGVVEKVKTGIIEDILQQGLIPIFPNIGWSATGKPYNISANELAYSLSVALNANKLFYITDSGGIAADSYKIPKKVYVSSDGLVSQLQVDEAQAMLKMNRTKGYKTSTELLRFGVRACGAGVDRVHILDGRTEGVLLKEIFSNRGVGTMIYANQHENIRTMTHADIPEVMRIMQPRVDEGVLVARTGEDMEKKLGDFAVYEVDGTIHACGALTMHPERKAEVCAVAVDEMYANLGTGRKMVSYLINKARRARAREVFVLTTQAADWFVQAGFTEAGVSSLPAGKRRSYDKKRGSLVLTYPMSKGRAKKTIGRD